ncbi:phosphatidylglycerol lysyltransferase domain-containing protein, partial [Streptomyces sp. W16]|uniref:phosphatidylglycerol lysyltransferase domain-containing protein n=1 Tax=Streptomyces sp. W16 TaxID=3076631 RepID=UPI00295A7802
MTATVEGARAKDTTGPIRPPGHGFLSRVPEGFATFFGALGLLCVLLAFIAPLRRVLRPVVRFLDLLIVPVSANLAYAVFLFLLAAATAARKKIAWWLVVVYLGLLVLTDVLGVALGLYAESLPSLIVCALLLVLLIVARRQFYAASRRAAVRRALAVLFAGLAVAILAGWGLVALFPGTLPTSQHLGWAADRVCGGLVSGRSFDGRPPRALFFLLGLFGALALLNAATVLFRSQRLEAALHGDEEARIRALLKAYGGQDSLGYFATRRDKAVVFSPTGKAAVTYRVEAGVCLASGDPVGDREAWPHAIAAWL